MPLLQPPRLRKIETAEYDIRARKTRSFKTVLDASKILEGGGRSIVTTTPLSGNRLEVSLEHKLARGVIHESCRFACGEGLTTLDLDRSLTDGGEGPCREERVDFTRGHLGLPEDVYPEVMLPFLLRAQPFDGERRAAHAWVVDRFVARVYFESRKHTTTRVPAGDFRTVEVLMFPDLNDWVPLSGLVTRLAWPFLPKYHMWYEVDAPHRLIRFEGPYGPPGAPEIVLELV